jgi:hypothetical protein
VLYYDNKGSIGIKENVLRDSSKYNYSRNEVGNKNNSQNIRLKIHQVQGQNIFKRELVLSIAFLL